MVCALYRKPFRNPKSQIPSSKEIPSFKHQTAHGEIGIWSLELLWDLELGIWDFDLHAAFFSSAAYLADNVTKTSSSDGPISWMSAWLMPTLRNFSSICARRTLSSTSRCID